MKKYLIRILKGVLDDQSRDYVKPGDIVQLIDKVKRQRTAKLAQPTQRHAIALEDSYLLILETILEKFGGQKRLAKTDLIKIVDTALSANNFLYKKINHRPKHANTLQPAHLSEKVYDLAFYNQLYNSPAAKTHHMHRGLKDIFYLRCEENKENILFGNMQIDDPREKVDWDNNQVRDVLLMRKNLYPAMVQEAIKHALSKKKTAIRFQTGDAVAKSQWEGATESRLENILITKENFEKYNALYETQRQAFAQAQSDDFLSPGQDILKRYHDTLTDKKNTIHHGRLVVKKTPEEIVYYPIIGSAEPPRLVNFIHLHYMVYSHNPKRDECVHKWDSAYIQMVKNFTKAPPAIVLRNLKQLFRAINKKLPPANEASQLEMITQAQTSGSTVIDDLDLWLDKFMLAFGYHKEFLAQHPEIMTYEVPPALAAQQNITPLRFENRNLFTSLHTKRWRAADLKKPVIGKHYLIVQAGEKTYLPDPACALIKIMLWYEKTLPEILTKLGLKFEKQTVTTYNHETRQKTQVWAITDGLDNFQTQPLMAFAAGGEFKVDAETSVRLQVAAAKFGCPPEKLRLVNDWLSAEGVPAQGSYNSRTDEITVAGRSLSILAHEGMHRLIKNGLVPPAEYRALVRAGKRLVATNSRWARRMESKGTKTGQPLYPSGRARNDEYAALFVEKYYTEQITARKYLMGAAVPHFTRAITYLKTVMDWTAAKLGNEPALLRGFFRRLESNTLTARRIKSPAQQPRRRGLRPTGPLLAQ